MYLFGCVVIFPCGEIIYLSGCWIVCLDTVEVNEEFRPSSGGGERGGHACASHCHEAHGPGRPGQCRQAFAWTPPGYPTPSCCRSIPPGQALYLQWPQGEVQHVCCASAVQDWPFHVVAYAAIDFQHSPEKFVLATADL